MAHFAKIENNVVIDVIVIDNEFENEGQKYINEVLKLDGQWIQTSYNNKIRNKFAGIGDIYNEDADVFIAKQPYLSWTLDRNYQWNPPKPYPIDGKGYHWNEELGEWVDVSETL
jgi:hypothetical protein